MRFAVFIVLLLSSVALGADLQACASFTNSDVVFAGKVAAIDVAQKSEDLPEGTKKVRFQVTRNFKGAENPTFALFSDGSFPFKKGQTWIVFASNDIVHKSFAATGATRIEKESESAQLGSITDIAVGNTPATVGGVFVRGAAGDSASPIEILVSAKGFSANAIADQTGSFGVELPKSGKYRVKITIPFDTSVIWPDRLLGTNLTRGNPTIFEYDIELEKGDCSYSKFELK